MSNSLSGRVRLAIEYIDRKTVAVIVSALPAPTGRRKTFAALGVFPFAHSSQACLSRQMECCLPDADAAWPINCSHHCNAMLLDFDGDDGGADFVVW